MKGVIVGAEAVIMPAKMPLIWRAGKAIVNGYAGHGNHQSMHN
jgi:hypothetical protein